MRAFDKRNFSEPAVRPDIIGNLRREAPRYAWTDERVLLCFTCDPYQQLDEKEKITRSVIKILKENNIPFQVLTKGGMRAARDFDLYTSRDAFATTLTLLDEQRSKEIEPNAATPANRMEAIIKAHKAGIETWVSLEPVIDAGASLAIIAMTHEYVDLYKIGKMNHRATSINWRDFGRKAIDLCHKLQKKYYIKDDLAAFLGGVEFTNTDTRRCK